MSQGPSLREYTVFILHSLYDLIRGKTSLTSLKTEAVCEDVVMFFLPHILHGSIRAVCVQSQRKCKA